MTVPGDDLEIRLLGPVEVSRGGKTLSLGGPRQRALLALLALEPGRTISADRLVEELWAGEPPPGAATTLRSYVSRLRGSSALPIRSTSGGYALDVGIESVDALRFERLAGEASAALREHRSGAARDRFATALGLWRGEAFAGISSAHLAFEADRLAGLRVDALEGRIEAELGLGRGVELVPQLEGLVTVHAYRETFWRQLMLALYRAGRQADALDAYQRARTLLDEQLGVEPGEELERLQLAILRREVPVARPADDRHNVPTNVSSFVGRKDALAAIGELLVEHRLVTITGVGGVGKTRVSVEVARSEIGRHRDGVWYADLAPLSDASLVADRIASILGVDEGTTGPPSTELIRHLRDREVLLVLDNCEHLRDACAALVSWLLREGPRVRVLATSREALGIPGEVDYALDPLAVPKAAESGRPDDVEAVRLFIARAREARPDFAADAQVLETIGRICGDLDGLPLAIELAAAKVRTLTPFEIAERLDDRFRFLVSWRRLATARHQTLLEAMRWSYELLVPSEQAFLRRAAVFASGFSLAGAATLCTDGDDDEALRLTERLIDASLLTARSEANRTRYRMLETVRQFAVSVTGQPEIDEIATAHVAYCIAIAEAARRRFDLDGVLEGFRDLLPEDADLRVALHRVAVTDANPDLELRFCVALWRYWWLHGQLREGRSAIGHALERASMLATGSHALSVVELHRAASTLALRQGDIAAAIAEARRATEIADGVDDITIARAEVALANAIGSSGDLDGAAALYETATRAFRRHGLRWELANALLNTADNAFGRGDLDLAEQAASESLAYQRETGDDAGIAVNLGNLAFTALERGEVDRAEMLLREALERSHAIGALEWIAIMLGGLAAIAVEHGDYGRSARLVGAAGRIRDEIGASLDSVERGVHLRTLATLEDSLPDTELQAAIGEGRALDTSGAVGLALNGEVADR